MHDLEKLCVRIRKSGIFGFDTEFISEYTYRPVLALIQVALPKRVELIDAQAIPDLSQFWELVIDSRLTTIVHAAEQEVRFCWYACGALPKNTIDLQVAAGLIGKRFPMGYGNLVQSELGVRLRQAHGRTDWSRRPLADSQIRYAMEDAQYLLPLWERIEEQITKLERKPWLEEEMVKRTDYLYADLSEVRWWRVGGIRRLSQQELAAVRELYHWREKQASSRNIPRKRILHDDLIVLAAKSMPQSPDELRIMRGFEKIGNKDVKSIVDCIAVSQRVSKPDLPELRKNERTSSPSDGRERMLVAFLEVILELTSAKKQVNSSLLASSSELRT